MTRRHEKIKPHLTEQYNRQQERIDLWIRIAHNALYNPVTTGINMGSFFSTRFKK